MAAVSGDSPTCELWGSADRSLCSREHRLREEPQEASFLVRKCCDVPLLSIP